MPADSWPMILHPKRDDFRGRPVRYGGRHHTLHQEPR